jgi:hypothetical protein
MEFEFSTNTLKFGVITLDNKEIEGITPFGGYALAITHSIY